MTLFGDTFYAWTVIFCIWFPLIMMWTSALIDVFRRNDLSGLGTAGWLILIFVLPFVGVLIYFVVRPKPDYATGAYPYGRGPSYSAAGPATTSTATELEKLANLKEQGVLTEAEFNSQKAKLMG